MRSECIVFVYLPGQVKAVPAGVLTIQQAGREAASTFVYGSGYRRRENAISLDPAELPLPERDAQVMRPLGGNPLFGITRDAAPDAWGRLVINDRYVRTHKYPNGSAPLPNAIDLPEIEYLLRSRADRVGALDFRETPTTPEPTKRLSGLVHLSDLVREAHRIALNQPPRSVELATLLRPATGMGGARPKTTIEDGQGQWLAKFPMENDALPITRIEHAMLDLAAKCSMQTIEHKLLHVEGVKEPVFMIRRFDRKLSESYPGQYEHVGYCSALTALGLDEYVQSTGSYQALAMCLRRRAGADTQADERRELFRRMVFNVLVNNDDDHCRNHGFLQHGPVLQLAPVFDIVPRVSLPGVGTQRRQAIGVGLEGREGTVRNMLSDTAPFGLTREQAARELADVAREISRHWRACAMEAGISPADIHGLEGTMAFADQVLEELRQEQLGDTPPARSANRQRR
jgi:serine/threonine-protein kinase HipA